MRIILCCAGGIATTMLMKNMENVVKNSKKLNDDDFEFKAIP
ncbi:PTS sugar transporter subunit IIB, partial [Clostridioides difficile]|nr:PTS sugar transporter subunit IIB [Clostridioides difficile]